MTIGTDERPAWERRPGEPPRAFHSFTHYRDGGPKRSILNAWLRHKTECDHVVVPPGRLQPPKRWRIYSVDWGWLDRVAAWEAEIDRLARMKMIQEQVDARLRHARTFQGTLTALTAPVKAMLDALGDATVMQQVVASARSGHRGSFELLALIVRAAQVMPAIAQAERLALGMSTESIEVDDKREPPVVARILGDPAATDLAIALLDRCAGTGADTPFGTGLVREPGEVADGAAPEPPDPEAG